MRTLSIALAAALALPLVWSPSPSDAASTELILIAARIREQTPSCAERPNAPVRGYVVGMAGTRPSRTLSFVGCFNSFEECERWRGPVSGVITRRMIQNRCAAR